MKRAHLTFAFMLVSAALARIVMKVMGTPLLDPDVAELGVAIAAIAGGFTSLALDFLHTRDGWRRASWALIPTAGAFVGMTMQFLLLANKPGYRKYVIAEGITSSDPVSWILVGGPFGALPALVAGALLFSALRFAFRTPSLDVRERTVLPITLGCTLLTLVSLVCINGLTDAIVVGVTLILGVLALIQLLYADRKRAEWLRRVFAGEDPSFSIEPFGGDAPLGVPHAVGGIDPRVVIVGRVDDTSYRVAARAPHALAASTIDGTVRPILVRRKIILTALASTVAMVLCGSLFVVID